MSARMPVRRLGQPCLAAVHPRSPQCVFARAFANTSTRSAAGKGKDGEKTADLSNPLLYKLLRDREAAALASSNKRRATPKFATGDLPTKGIFKEEYEMEGYEPDMSPEEVQALKASIKRQNKALEEKREWELQAGILDPVPAARRAYERRLVIEELTKQRVGKTLKLKRTERELTYKSQTFPTSVKKMTRLMHQIQGKTIEEALIQMRFSKKRVARDVVKALLLARDEAIAARGMGLGAGIDSDLAEQEESITEEGNEAERLAEKNEEQEESEFMTAAEKKAIYLADGTHRRKFAPNTAGTVVELRDGTKKTIMDPTEIYIDRAWTNKGPVTKSKDYRARGQGHQLIHRTTSFSVQLKEEKTRMRISEEIQKKRANRPLWVALPDRPVTSQRQYCLW